MADAARSGPMLFQVKAAVVDRMRAMRRSGESCSEVHRTGRRPEVGGVTPAQRQMQNRLRATSLRIIVLQTAAMGCLCAAPRSTQPKQSYALAMHCLELVRPRAALPLTSWRRRNERARALTSGALSERSTRCEPGAPRCSGHGHQGQSNASRALRDRDRADW
jgi:hypothetical protein